MHSTHRPAVLVWVSSLNLLKTDPCPTSGITGYKTLRVQAPMCAHSCQLQRHELILLHLPTQICFLIGEEHVTCCGSKLTNFLEQTKLTNSLAKHYNLNL